MSGAFSTYLKNALLNATIRNVTYTSPAIVYLALFTTDPGAGNTGTEVTGGSYARQAVTFSAPVAGPGTSQQCVNSGDVVFPQATASWGTISYWGLYDA